MFRNPLTLLFLVVGAFGFLFALGRTYYLLGREAKERQKPRGNFARKQNR